MPAAPLRVLSISARPDSPGNQFSRDEFDQEDMPAGAAILHGLSGARVQEGVSRLP
jgi:hypothetical protein